MKTISKSRKWLLVVFLSISFVTVYSQDFYVASNGNDNNPGTESSPFKTVQKAINSTSAGSTVFIGAGTYEMAGYSKNLNYRISIIGEDKNTTVLNNIGALNIIGTSASNGFTMRDLKFTNYGLNVILFKAEDGKILDKILIKNILFDEVMQTGKVRIIQARDGFKGKGTIKNLEISNCDFLGAEGSSVACIFIYGNKKSGEQGGFISKITIINNTFKDLRTVGSKGELYAILVGIGANNATTKDVVISGNYIENLAGVPIKGNESHGIGAYGTNLKVTRNTVKGMNPGGDNEGIYTKASNSLIANNVMINSTSDQGAIAGKGKGHDVTYRDNRIQSNQSGRGLYSTTPKNITVENNYIKNTANDSRDGIFVYRDKKYTGSPSACYIRNNYVESKEGISLTRATSGEIANNMVIAYNSGSNFPIKLNDSPNITFKGNTTRTSKPNSPPKAVASSNITQGNGPLSIDFTGSNSTDNGSLSYQWNFHDGTTSTSQNPSHTFTDIRTYMVTLIVTDSDGFKDMAYVKIRVDEKSGATLTTNQFQDTIDIVIFPNPSANEINIQFLETIKVESVSIYDVLGKEVFTEKIEISETNITLNPNLSKGVYFLKIDSDKGELSKKIIIK